MLVCKYQFTLKQAAIMRPQGGGGSVREVVLSIINLPPNLTDFTCIYHINTLTDFSVRVSNLVSTLFDNKQASVTRYDVDTGTVACQVSQQVKVALLNASEKI